MQLDWKGLKAANAEFGRCFLAREPHALDKAIRAYLAAAKPYEAGQLAMRERAADIVYIEQDLHEEWVNRLLGDIAEAISNLQPEEPPHD
jgi:hypothetical protein